MNRISALGLCSLGGLLVTVSCRDFGKLDFEGLPGEETAGVSGSLAGDGGTVGSENDMGGSPATAGFDSAGSDGGTVGSENDMGGSLATAGSDSAGSDGETGGNAGNAGIAGTIQVGGSGDTGGSVQVGSSGDTGGSVEVGGSGDTGGSIQVGGSGDTGGSVEVGGSGDTGGSVEVGGSGDTGGSVQVGGSGDTGGSVEVGGSGDTGGSVEIGGSGDTGGSIQVGGSGGLGGSAGNGGFSGAAGTLVIPPTDEPLLPERRVQSTATPWNVGNTAGNQGITICYLERPRVPPRDPVMCTKQVSQSVDCVGEAPPAGAPSLMDLRATVRYAVLDTWERASRLELFHWLPCPIDGSGRTPDSAMPGWIALGFSNHDVVDWAGRPAEDEATGVYLDWRKLLRGDYSGVVHAFGHALGLADEWEKPNYVRPAECSPPTDDYDALGLFNSQLVDYGALLGGCYPLPPEPILSAGDVLIAQSVYGRHTTGSLLSYQGHCVVSRGLDQANQMFPCRNETRELWTWIPEQRTLRTIHPTGPLCMAVYGAAVSDTGPTDTIATSCAGTPAQRFTVENTQWRALGALCVNDSEYGLVAQRCTESSDTWRFFDTDPATPLEFDQIGYGSSSLCVAAPPDPQIGDRLSLVECDANDPSQQFETPGDGLLVTHGLCVVTPATELRDPLISLILTDQCGGISPPAAAQFHATGEVHALGQCLTMPDTPPEGQAFYATMLGCNSELKGQRWDYLF